jgi:uncharacterized protein YpuA (DUF1002 family)
MDATLNADSSDHAAADAAPSPLTKLTRAQVFARDPEEVTQADLQFVVDELTKINARNRKARQDDAALAEGLTKIKKANVAAKKKKDAGKVATNILDTKL